MCRVQFVLEVTSQQSSALQRKSPLLLELQIIIQKLIFFCLFLEMIQAGVCCGPCNPSKCEADIWGWLEVRRSAMLHYTVNQRPHWACRQYGHSGGTKGWLGVKRCQLCLQDTSHSAKWHWRLSSSGSLGFLLKIGPIFVCSELFLFIEYQNLFTVRQKST